MQGIRPATHNNSREFCRKRGIPSTRCSEALHFPPNTFHFTDLSIPT